MSIVIPSYGRYKSLEVLLQCLQQQSIRNQLEILIIDQNKTGFLTCNLSTQSLEDIIIIDDIRPNVSLARNVGREASSNEWILFIDDDLEPRKDFCEKLIERINGNYGPCLAPLVYSDKDGEIEVQALKKRKDAVSLEGYVVRVFDVISAAFVINKQSYDLVSGFDVELFDFVKCTEDKDFFTRLNSKGIQVNVDTKNRIYHSEEIEGGCELRLDDYWDQRMKFMKGWIYMKFKKNGRAVLKLSDRISLYRSALFNKLALKSGLKYLLKAQSCLREAERVTTEYWNSKRAF